jgi:hypothetical protein
MPEEKRGWPDWVKGIALYALRPDGTLGMIMTDEAGNLRVVFFPHAITHQKGGSDELNVQGLSGVLANLQYAKLSYVGTRATFPTNLEAGALAYATDEKVLYRWDGSSWVKLTAGTFISLMDTPNSYQGKAGYYPRVKATEDGLEFVQFATPGPHANDHRKDGVDPLPTASPAAITEGASASEGTSAVFARADHIHASPSEWTPKVHGNTKHFPEFLARDGSNTMAGIIRGDSQAPYYSLEKLFLNQDIDGGFATPIPLLQNDLAFLEKKGGSVSFNPAPTSGSDKLFDGTVQFALWNNPSGTITVEVTLHRTFYYTSIVYVQMPYYFRAKNVTAEYYDPVDTTWKSIGSVTNWGSGLVAWIFNAGINGVSKLRFYFSNFHSSTSFRIVEIGLIYYSGELSSSYLLSRGGSKMYGDIDMNSYNVNNPNLVDGVDVSAHASRHRKDGADPLPTGTPGTLTEGATPSEGTAAVFARADHVHGTPSQWTPKAHASTHRKDGSDPLPTAAPAAITEGASASEGTSAVFARADHVHATPSQWTPKTHGNDKHSPNNFAAIVWRVPSGADWSGTAPTSWTTLNFQGIWGNRRVLACITVYNAGSGDNNYNFMCPDYNRPNSHLYADTYPGITKCRVASATSESILIWTDAYGLISWRAQNAYSTLLYVEWYMYVP